MRIQGEEFKDGTIIINAETKNLERAGAAGYFAVVDVYIEYPDGGFDSILKKVSVVQEKFYQNAEEVLEDLGVAIDEVEYKLEFE